MDDRKDEESGRTGSLRPVSESLPRLLKHSVSNAFVETGSEPPENLEIMTMAIGRATLMYATSRFDDAADPDLFIDAAALILSEYPPDVIIAVTDPRTGVASRVPGPPRANEVKEACEKLMAPIRARERRERALAETLARRKDSLALEENRLSRPTLDQLREQHPQLLGRDKERVKLQEAFEQANRELHRRVETALRHSRVKMDIEARRQRSNENVDAREQQPAHRRILGS